MKFTAILAVATPLMTAADALVISGPLSWTCTNSRLAFSGGEVLPKAIYTDCLQPDLTVSPNVRVFLERIIGTKDGVLECKLTGGFGPDKCGSCTVSGTVITCKCFNESSSNAGVVSTIDTADCAWNVDGRPDSIENADLVC
ncbi:hypothetical protein MKZ38_010681 [Zalerion maritima]|uniref:Cyanovirin-N domain-containing protein n=1 Tax=Zalerion maritima TaxID=339359 RepID=A0AAD5RS25_9PEZI|nr:hypothetical protein MKZ38_010681 [Zalerion maritima]